MKVLQINSVCGVGSTGRIAIEIDNILKSQGHQGIVAFGRGEAQGFSTTIKIGGVISNYIHVIITRLFDKHGFGSKAATNRFLKEVDKYQPDIIHLHNIHGYYINIELLFNYLVKLGKPVIWTMHDCWSITGHCAYFDYAKCDRWKAHCKDCPQKKSYPKSCLVDNSGRNFQEKAEMFTGIKNMTIVTPSKWLSNIISKSFLYKYPVQVIPNGIDIEVFKPVNSDFRNRYHIEDLFIILGVANVWEQRKGLQYFIELSKRIDSDMKIVLVGLTEKQKHSLPSNIVGITRTRDALELAEIYSSVDVFINPTLEDNFPTTNIEALACGAPVITFDTGGCSESVNETVGAVVEKGDIDGLISAIYSVKERGKQHYSAICRAHAEQFFNKEQRFNDYIKLYETLFTN